MATADDELARLTRGAVELARRGQPEDQALRLTEYLTGRPRTRPPAESGR